MSRQCEKCGFYRYDGECVYCMKNERDALRARVSELEEVRSDNLRDYARLAGRCNEAEARIRELEGENARLREALERAAICVLAARDALIPTEPDRDEAYHQLYMWAESLHDDPYHPWVELERIARAALANGERSEQVKP